MTEKQQSHVVSGCSILNSQTLFSFKDFFADAETLWGWVALINCLKSYLICIRNTWINNLGSLSSKSFFLKNLDRKILVREISKSGHVERNKDSSLAR